MSRLASTSLLLTTLLFSTLIAAKCDCDCNGFRNTPAIRNTGMAHPNQAQGLASPVYSTYSKTYVDEFLFVFTVAVLAACIIGNLPQFRSQNKKNAGDEVRCVWGAPGVGKKEEKNEER